MKYARVEKGIVMEIIDVGDNDINEMFHIDIVNQCVPCNDSTTQGMTYDGVDFGPVPAYVPTWEEIRETRNYLLLQSDWTQVPDASVDQEEWRIYRQKLRDITKTYTKPEDVIWPVRPSK